MNKDKQIEEMARDLENHTCMSEFQAEIASRMLCAKGYRKADDVAREIFEAFRDEMRSLIATSKELFNECEDDYYEGKKDAFFTAIIHLDELIKKKYTEDGE